MKRYRVTYEAEGKMWMTGKRLSKAMLVADIKDVRTFTADNGGDVTISQVRIEDITPPKKK